MNKEDLKLRAKIKGIDKPMEDILAIAPGEIRSTEWRSV